ncbi:zinc ABC transporter substrate-binding protein [Marinovum sp.]|uniref:zinc ABC transporter substrate-binding protein n=1 Tax=Marinovum sp. TaxID=2024839 RepID=UPI002B2721F1|nr:zinc ABC transporter substrate-binding protein [Marinovum sp.]
MMQKIVTLSFALGAFAGTSALAEVPQVATDIAPVHGLVSRVMQGLGTPELIVPAGASPHDFALRPSQARALQGADLVFWMGPALAPWLDRTLDSLSLGAVIDLNARPETRLLGWRESFGEGHDHGPAEDAQADRDDHAHEDHAEHDHEGHDHGEADHAGHDHESHYHDAEDHAAHDHDDHAGHDHGDRDPHSWLDPENAKAWSLLIAETLAEADPQNAGTYRANAEAGVAEIEAAAQAAEALLAPHHDAGFLVFHDAYHYFETRFDLHAAGSVSLGDAAAPGPARVRALQVRVAEEGIACLFAEPQFERGLIETLAEGTGARIATLDPLGSRLETGASFYPGLIGAMAEDIAGCLGG